MIYWVTTSDKEWYNESQRMTTSDNEWQRVTTSGTASENEWNNEWQQVTTNDNKWQRVTKNDNEWQRMTASDNEWQRVIQWVITNNSEGQRVIQRMKTNESKWWQVKESDFGFRMKQDMKCITIILVIVYDRASDREKSHVRILTLEGLAFMSQSIKNWSKIVFLVSINSAT